MPSIAADPGYRGVGHGWWVWLGRGVLLASGPIRKAGGGGGVVGAVGF